jgi:cell wall-associated NlpC family hydrolase
MVGPGWARDSGGDPATLLAGVRDALTDTGAAARSAWSGADGFWRGTAATAAAEFAAATATAVDSLAHRAEQLSTTATAAASAVARARERLEAIIDRFEARAAALEPHLRSPGAAEELVAEAQRSLSEALAVVDELRAELDGHATRVAATQGPPVPTAAPTTPAGFSGTPGLAPGVGGFAPPTVGNTGSGLGQFADFSSGYPDASPPLPDAARFGDGVAVRLPDGATVTAPNAVAAGAVRHALTQLGVPYQWGGTTPGVGLDCSGLTQWAYHEAGLDIPRLAQEQDVGAGVDPGSLRPGDLAVWDGHVAMIVGNGMMIEAGDPVQLSPVRTTNAGQGFQGFFRPTG